MILQFLKPFVMVWACLNVIDDATVVAKFARLMQATTFQRRNKGSENMCDVCDNLMEDLLKGSEAVEAIPCSWICLGTSKCINMCETIQSLTEKSMEYPCIVAGYCTTEEVNDNDFAKDEVVCKKGPLFSCEPQKFCRKKREKFGFKYTCDLKPGMGRWLQLKKRAQQHAVAMADGLLYQKRCGEPDAGPYCIAKPSGYGQIAEFLGWFLSIVYGGYASTVAIETPGGDDDQQWLTFWVIFVTSMLFEQTFARVLLSKYTFYYQIKLVFIVWLTFFDGAACLYRRFRLRMSEWSLFFAANINNNTESTAQKKLNSIIRIGGVLITFQIVLLEQKLKRNPKKRNSYMFLSSLKTDDFWEYDYSDTNVRAAQTTLVAEERLYQISKWILSSRGMEKMERALDMKTVSVLLEHAAAVVAFQPKFLNIRLIGTKNVPRGRLPAMDSTGKADCYIKFALLSDRELSVQNRTDNQSNADSHMGGSHISELKNYYYTVTSRIARRTIEPEWNQKLEISMKDGALDEDGSCENNEIKDTILLAEAWHANCGKWGVALDTFQFIACLFTCVLNAAYMKGFIDFLFHENLSPEQWWWKSMIMLLTFLLAFGLTLSWLMSVVWKADDEFIGESRVPLEILTDRQTHSLILKLHNGKAERGVLRVKLSLSEN